ncbi:hypothetical protein N665_2314s0001 [Sinapis alba]|nr:hypothetical protein N665_2314s0001 [Sinapis alba]
MKEVLRASFLLYLVAPGKKLALAVVMSDRKLRPHFQSHTIVVLMSFPLRTILHSPSQSGIQAKWKVELKKYDIEYRAKDCAKLQVLANFLVELPTECTMNQEPDSTWTLHVDGSSSKQGSRIGIRLTSPTEEYRAKDCAKLQVLANFLVELPTECTMNQEPDSTWTLHVDGSSSKQGSRIGIRLTSPTEEVLEQLFRLIFPAANNEAEYKALIAGLRLARGLKILKIHVYCDSQLVANQHSRGSKRRKNGRLPKGCPGLNPKLRSIRYDTDPSHGKRPDRCPGRTRI